MCKRTASALSGDTGAGAMGEGKGDPRATPEDKGERTARERDDKGTCTCKRTHCLVHAGAHVCVKPHEGKGACCAAGREG